MSRLVRALLVACAAAALPAPAETFRLDDSMSQVFPPVAEWQWLPYGARGGETTLEMNVRVNVRIDTTAWVGRSGRIYMVLPLDPGGPLVATWDARGPLLSGRLEAGERTLVYSGTISTPMLEDTLNVRITSDARLRTVTTRRLAFHFEFDTP